MGGYGLWIEKSALIRIVLKLWVGEEILKARIDREVV
jgi:hypothetical protein